MAIGVSSESRLGGNDRFDNANTEVISVQQPITKLSGYIPLLSNYVCAVKKDVKQKLCAHNMQF